MNPTARTCPACHQPLPSDAPQGLCPQCLAKSALGSQPGAEETVASGSKPGGTGPAAIQTEISRLFPQLEILAPLGQGGMGMVYKARQLQLDRIVALKVMRVDLSRDPAFAERFAREARALAKLNHPNIVSVFDFGQSGGHCWILMEFVDGTNLRELLRTKTLAPREALGIVPKVCDALQYAHDEGIVHRDIKPENILLDKKGRVKIADFGLAKLVGKDTSELSLTATGMTLGTPRYMAPEQFDKPQEVDHRADIYSLGVVLYEMLTGEVPMGRFSLPSATIGVDVRLDEIVLRTLEKEPSRRYQHVSEVKTQVENVTGIHPAQTLAGPSPVTAAIHPAGDFLLCNPRLSRMAQAITVFALLIAPMMYLVDLFTLESLPAGSRAAMVQGLVNLLLVVGGFVSTAVLVVGGIKLRNLRPSGPQILQAGLWLLLAEIMAAATIAISGELVAPEAGANPPTMTMGEAFVSAGAIMSLAFVITALVWLRRNRQRLAEICRAPGTLGSSIVAPTLVHEEPRLSRLALWGAIWAAVGLLGAIPLVIIYITHQTASGVVRPSNAVLFLAVILGFISLSSMFGTTIMGSLAIAQIKRSNGKLYGLRLAFADAIFFPLLAGFVCIAWLVAKTLSSLADISLARTEMPGALVSLVVCCFIGRMLWCKVSPPLEETTSAFPASPLDHRVSEALMVGLPGWFNRRAPWAQKLIQSALTVAVAFATLVFLGFNIHSKTDVTAGQVSNSGTVQVGQPSPWLTVDFSSTNHSFAIHWFSASLWIGFAGLALGCLSERLRRSVPGFDEEKDRRKRQVWLVVMVVVLVLYVAGLVVNGLIMSGANSKAARGVTERALGTKSAVSMNPYTFAGLPAPFVKGADGPELSVQFVKQMGFTPLQVVELNKTFQSYYRQFLSLERQHTELSRNAQGHVIVKIAAFPDESLALAQRMAQELRGLVGKEVIPAPQPGMLMNIGLFRHAGEASVTAELWKENGIYFFKEERIGAPNAAHLNEGVPSGRSTSGDKLIEVIPEEYRVYWKE